MDRWRRIGTRLYLALGFAVALTLVSGAVGVYYFEQSGDANYQVRSESVPALEASWAAAREAERLRNLGLGLIAAESGLQGSESEAVAGSLERLETALSQVRSVPDLAPLTASVSDAAFDLAEVIDELTFNRDELRIANEAAADYRLRLATTTSDIGESDAALSVLQQALQADEVDSLDGLWDESQVCMPPVLTRLWRPWERVRGCSSSAAGSSPWKPTSGIWHYPSTHQARL